MLSTWGAFGLLENRLMWYALVVSSMKSSRDWKGDGTGM
jgi:hypothetical protein